MDISDFEDIVCIYNKMFWISIIGYLDIHDSDWIYKSIVEFHKVNEYLVSMILFKDNIIELWIIKN